MHKSCVPLSIGKCKSHNRIHQSINGNSLLTVGENWVRFVYFRFLSPSRGTISECPGKGNENLHQKTLRKTHNCRQHVKAQSRRQDGRQNNREHPEMQRKMQPNKTAEKRNGERVPVKTPRIGASNRLRRRTEFRRLMFDPCHKSES